MAYYLTIEKRKGEYTPLEITSSKYFARVSNLVNNGATLEEIDIYTMMFNDEGEFRKALFKEGLIKMSDTRKSLSIRKLSCHRYEKVMYGFLFQKDMEYVMEPKLIIERINDKLYKGDYRFIESLANHYHEYYECKTTAADLRNAASNAIKYNDIKRLSEHDENGDNLVERMAKLLIYEYYIDSKGKIKYTDRTKYRNIHSLIAFTNYYDKKYQDEVTEYNNQLDIFNTAKPKEKSLKKPKNAPLEGQTSLFE